jgi:hypothetical protein
LNSLSNVRDSWLRAGGLRNGTRVNGLKDRKVLSDWNCNLQRVSGTFVAVIVGEALAEPVGLHTNDGIRVLIERYRPAENFEGNGILLDVTGLACELALTKIGQKISKRGRTNESRRRQHRLQFGTLGIDRNRFRLG